MLFLCITSICAQAYAESARIPLSAPEIQALGGDIKHGTYYRLADQPALNDSDALMPKGGSTKFSSIAGMEFRPIVDGANFFSTNHAALGCFVNSISPLAEAQVQLPQGATLQVLRIWGSDGNENDLNVKLIERCQPITTPGNVTTTVLTTVASANSPGRFTTSAFLPANTTVDNTLCTYAVRVQLNSVLNGCAPNLALDKVRLQWNP